MKKQILRFFNELELYEDIHNSTQHKSDIRTSISKFLKQTNEKTAYDVYDSFFRAYWIGIQNKENPFLKLTEALRKYEENAGRLIDKQRDHYVHSVNVFLMGLVIYSGNDKFRNHFNNYALNKTIYPDSYDTKYEEFFYRWGLASLFHDIAYPLEITLKQANKYFDFIWCYPNEVRIQKHSFIELPGFNEFIKQPQIKPSKKYKEEFYEKYPSFESFYERNAMALLTKDISSKLGLQAAKVKKAINNYMKNMEKEGFVDHGFYSAIIMLRWYYHLLKTTKWNPAYYYYPILDSASAIMLHNYYKRVLMKQPFNLGRLKVSRHPIAYMLILCDGLQDWNRRTYSENKCDMILPTEIKIYVDNNTLKLSYISASNKRSSKAEKEYKSSVLNLNDIFVKGIKITRGA